MNRKTHTFSFSFRGSNGPFQAVLLPSFMDACIASILSFVIVRQ